MKVMKEKDKASKMKVMLVRVRFKRNLKMCSMMIRMSIGVTSLMKIILLKNKKKKKPYRHSITSSNGYPHKPISSIS
jgi:hypothetical protein